MSEDATYDMIQAGKKVRCLMVPFGEPRELAGTRPVGDLNRLTWETKSAMWGLTKSVSDAGRRIAALEADKRGETVSYTPETSESTLQAIRDEQRHERGGGTGDHKRPPEPKPDEYSCKVDRTTGTIDQER